ncbi:MAG TPA: polysaccharide pyruvyl transferase family protein [Ignavibacteria bacterium]|nr:polysaccharide pyruvyl transferase family protein [Ignavibacteria bacterium]
MKLKSFKKHNFGDLPLNRYLFEKINGKFPEIIGLDDNCSEPHLIISGSILSHANQNSIIWGAGFMHETDQLTVKPHRIYAVRGQLTWEILARQGVKAPYIFGDPALLLPKYYKARVDESIYNLGIIPHYVDLSNPLLDKFRNPGSFVKIIDVYSGVESFIDQINDCSYIVSSSLHGLIVADAYGIPNGWIKISDKVNGNGFKFRDYFTTCIRSNTVPLCITKHISIIDLIDICEVPKLNLALDKLEASCPIGRV